MSAIAEPVLAFEEIAQFLASLSPNKVLAFKTSKKSQARVRYLIEKNKTQGLDADETREMEQHMLVEHMVQMAKAKSLLRIVKK